MSRGMDESTAHAAAEKLEHLHDRRVLDVFDNELDHPDADAHGHPIPGEQEKHPERAPLVYISLMRSGDRGRIVERAGATVEGLPPGTGFQLQERDPASGDWIVITDNGDSVRVTHDMADDVAVDISN